MHLLIIWDRPSCVIYFPIMDYVLSRHEICIFAHRRLYVCTSWPMCLLIVYEIYLHITYHVFANHEPYVDLFVHHRPCMCLSKTLCACAVRTLMGQVYVTMDQEFAYHGSCVYPPWPMAHVFTYHGSCVCSPWTICLPTMDHVFAHFGPCVYLPRTMCLAITNLVRAHTDYTFVVIS